MLTEIQQYATYICPNCGQVTTTLLNPFIFSGRDSINIFCPATNCCTTCINISKQGKGYIIEAACPFCGDVHGKSISRSDFWNKDLITLSCNNAGGDFCFFGSREKIKKAFVRTQQIFEERAAELDESDYFEDFEASDGDPDTGYLISSIMEGLHFMNDIDALSCKCGSHDITLTVVDDTVCIRCKKCGKRKLIEPTDEFLSELSVADSFVFNI